MTQDLETILRKSLNQVDRSIKVFWAQWFFGAAAVVAGLLWLKHLSNTADVKTLLVISVAFLVFAQAVNSILTSVAVIDMTRKALKAIEPLSRE
jgi:apolipoprotein N-acyltransferase